MKSIQAHVEKFKELFRGNADAYGLHIPEKNPVEGQKAQGKSFTKTEPLTHEHYLEHLCGEASIGIIPIDANHNIRFGAIDVDEYPSKPEFYLRLLQRAKLPLVAFRSKSGGLHLYVFFSVDTPAAKAVPVLDKIRQLLGLASDTEIFPKQKRLLPNQTGNYINIPYFDFEKTARYAYGSDGKELSLAEALHYAYTSRTTVGELQEILDEMPLAVAPPCLQTIYMSGGADEGERNCFLFNCGVYLKARFGKEFGENLHLLNSKMLHPLEYEELDKTTIASHNRQDYTYQCGNSILKNYCDKAMCASRKFGKGGGEISDLTFEKLIQVKSTSPYYIWYVNGEEMIFYNESELMNQNKFRELCLRKLHIVPDRLTDKAWNKTLNRALEQIEVEEVESVDDLSRDSLWVNKVGEFLSRQRALRPSQLEQGLVWFDNSKGRLHFKGTKMLEFLDACPAFRDFTPAKHRTLLKEIGAKQGRVRYADMSSSIARTWYIKLEEVQKEGLFLDIETPNKVNGEKFEALNFAGEEKF